MKVLFVCNQGQNRSKTAEVLFKDKFETRSTGLYNNLLTEKDLLWADIVFVMEDFQRSEIAKRFPKMYLKKHILSLDVADIYRFEQPELIEELNKKVNQAILEIA